MFGLGAIVDQAAARAKRKFNLLMTEEREYYFQDYAGFMHVADANAHQAATPFLVRDKLKGRLHVCSKSLVFDPDDLSCNITRLPFREIASIKGRRAATPQGEVEYIVIHTRMAVEIPPHASYIFHKYDLSLGASEFYFSLSYVDLGTVLAFIHQLHGLYRLPAAAKPLALADIIRQREESIPFESSAIQDIHERVLLPGGSAILAQQVQPLLLCPGRFQLTDARIYFQGFNTVSSEATSRVDIADIRRMYKRRYVMRDTALEVFLQGKPTFGSATNTQQTIHSNTLTQTSVYFNFPTHALRDTVYNLIAGCDRFQPQQDQSLTSMTRSWASGATSNFEYLLFLNQQAGRSWMDLTQYPVMPWVLSDYTSPHLDLTDPSVFRDLSKPIGALDPERLQQFRRRMKEMPPEISQGHPFLYGTHYSSPGYVLYYLARKAPQYMLRLQSGKFDHPDRLFHSIESTWTSVLHSQADVKELIPEFYAAPSASPSSAASAAASEFLLNTQELDLGVRQNGHPVEDVTLPPWASSPHDFLSKMRAALECEHVSANLHQWIDLIFGYKQQGEEAIKADNVFYYLTYEGAIDLDSISDPQQRRSIELQINEFGQTPKRIFTRPHPRRFQEDTIEFDRQESESAPSTVPIAHQFTLPSSIGAASGFMRVDSDDDDDRMLPVSPQARHAPEATRSSIFASSVSPSLGSTALPLNQSLDGLFSPPLSTSAKDLADLDSGARALQLAAEVAEIQTKRLNVDDSELKRGMLGYAATSASSSAAAASAPRPVSSIKAGWPLMSSTGWARKESLALHRDVITSLQFADNNLVSVGADGHIKIYSLENSKLIRSSKVSDMTLSCCSVSPDSRLVYIASWDNHVFLYNQSFGRIVTSAQVHDDAVSTMSVKGDRMITGSWDTTVKLFQVTESAISARALSEFAEHEAAITALAMDARATTAASGSEDGGLILWDTRAKDGQSRQIEGFDSAVKCIDFSPHSNDFIVTAADGTMRHIDAGSGKTLFHVSTGECLNVVRSDGFHALGVGESGIVRGWHMRTGEEVIHIPTGGGAQTAFDVKQDGTTFAVANQRTLLFQQKQ